MIDILCRSAVARFLTFLNRIKDQVTLDHDSLALPSCGQVLLLRRRRRCRCSTAKKRNRGNDERSRPRHCARSYHFVIAVWRAKGENPARVKYREIIADNLSKAGWS
jgi:hypothetical protein